MAPVHPKDEEDDKGSSFYYVKGDSEKKLVVEVLEKCVDGTESRVIYMYKDDFDAAANEVVVEHDTYPTFSRDQLEKLGA